MAIIRILKWMLSDWTTAVATTQFIDYQKVILDKGAIIIM